MSKEILVIGGTGHVGAALVQDLVARGETVRVGTRRPEAVSAAGAKGVLVDLDRPETLGLASRISGVTPAAISLLLIHLRKGGHRAFTAAAVELTE